MVAQDEVNRMGDAPLRDVAADDEDRRVAPVQPLCRLLDQAAHGVENRLAFHADQAGTGRILGSSAGDVHDFGGHLPVSVLRQIDRRTGHHGNGFKLAVIPAAGEGETQQEGQREQAFSHFCPPLSEPSGGLNRLR